MPAIFHDKSNRQEAFAEFLQNKFGKNHELTKQDLLSLIQKDFNDKSINKTTIGSAGSLCSWYALSEDRQGKNRIFYILEDLGYAKTFGITEAEVKQSGIDKITHARDIFFSKENRQSVFQEFLQNKFGKNHELTKQDLLSLGRKDVADKSINKTTIGSAGSLYHWYTLSKDRQGKSISFHLLEDLGYAKTFGITEAEVKQSGIDRTTHARDIFSSKENRQIVFQKFLQNKLQKPPDQITKQDLLSLIRKDFADKSINKTTIGSAVSLYSWYALTEDRQGKNVIFYILEDLGYAQEFGITENDVKFRRKIVFVEDKLIPAEQKPQEELTEPLFQHDEQHVVQVVFSTVKNGNSHPKPTQSLRERALQYYFPGILAVSSKKAYDVLPEAKEGAKFVIHSFYPLDGIYQKGLALLGYEIKSQNLTNSQLNGIYFSVVERATVQNNAEIMFRNDLNPYNNALHILGQYSRLAHDSKTQAELHIAIDLALDWIAQMKKEGVLPGVQMDYVEAHGMAKLCSMEQRAMDRLGLAMVYDKRFGRAISKYDMQEIRKNSSLAMRTLGKVQTKLETRKTRAIERTKMG